MLSLGVTNLIDGTADTFPAYNTVPHPDPDPNPNPNPNPEQVETTFPLYSIPLVSGAFFNKKAASGAPGGVLDPAASLRAELEAEAPPPHALLEAPGRYEESADYEPGCDDAPPDAGDAAGYYDDPVDDPPGGAADAPAPAIHWSHQTREAFFG